MDKQQALNYFWNKYATAYEESDVPDDADIKTGYITYQKIIGSIEEPVFPTASIWTRSTSWARADAILNSIDDDLKNGGIILPIDGGKMWIERGSPFAQAVSEEDRSVRRYLLNIAVEFFTE